MARKDLLLGREVKPLLSVKFHGQSNVDGAGAEKQSFKAPLTRIFLFELESFLEK